MANHSRSGFSLLEIVFVLAVFVMISAMAVPMLLRSYSGQQLRAAADVVRARLAQARVRAIETGDIYAFFYSPGASDYSVAPLKLGFQALLEGQQITSQQDQLENKIVFAAGESIQDGRSSAELEQASLGSQGMRPVLFYPDGTSQDARVILQHENGNLIQVNLRGLTGNSASSRIFVN